MLESGNQYVHTDVHFPFLPLELVTIHLEADTIRLNNVQRFDVVTRLEVLTSQVGQEVELFCRNRDPTTVYIRKSVRIEPLGTCIGHGEIPLYIADRREVYVNDLTCI